MISDDELADARAAMAETFDTQAVIVRTESIPDPWGEIRIADRRLTVPGRLRPASEPRIVKQGEASLSVNVWLFRCAVDADMRKDEEVTIDGRSFVVVGSDAGRSGALMQVVQLREPS